MSIESPLHAAHLALGATMVDFAGWSMPVRYTSDTVEHNAVRQGAGLFDLSHMGELSVEGPGAAAGLDYALVGAMSRTQVGQAKYTMLCAPDGGVIDDLVVYRSAPDAFMVVANASNVGVVSDELRARLGGFDCTFTDTSMDIALIAVQGPKSEDIVEDMIADLPSKHDVSVKQHAAVAALKYYTGTHVDLACGVTAFVARTGYTGEDGYELFVASADAQQVWDLALERGGHALVPCGLASRDTLRLEAGMPLYGQELTRDVTPFDAGVGRIVHFADGAGPDGAVIERGDFVGREALAARRDGSAVWALVGLEGEGRRAARTGYAVTNVGGASIGTVTSGAPSPTLGKQIAMAYVEAEYAAVGTEVVVDIRGKEEKMTVTAIPFYKRGA